MEILISFIVGGVIGLFLMAMLNGVSYHKGYNDGANETLRNIYKRGERPAVREYDV